MNTKENKQEQFVLHHYKAGKLDTQQALRQVKTRAGMAQNSWTWRRLAVAASVLVLLAAGAFVLWNRQSETLRAGETAQTFALADGSKVTLAPHSTLTFRTREPRTSTLSGRAFFEVKHDEAHPFSVTTGESKVKVLGTKFEISEEAAETEVYVTEGKVLFGPKKSGEGVVLTVGQSAVLQVGAQIPTLEETENPNRIAWATHQFRFDATPLADVLTTLSDYYGVTLRAPKTDKRLTGEFETDSLETVISLIEQALDVKIDCKKAPFHRENQ